MRTKQQPTFVDTKDWTQQMVYYFKERWENEDKNKKPTTDNIAVEEIIESTGQNDINMKRWNKCLDRKFIDIVVKLGGFQAATPEKIIQHMKEDDITILELQNHLQVSWEKLHGSENSAPASYKGISKVVYIVEFQKRGLPHAHICTFFAKESKIPSPEDINHLISAEIPNEQQDPKLYKLVYEQMMHGQCGPYNMTSTFMKKKIYSKKFPKDYTEKTYINDNGYAIYKRPNNNKTVVKNGIYLDNRYVMPYNPLLMKKFQAHINVEWCNQSGAIKYIFKYINKGQERVTIAFEKEKTNDNPLKRKDKIKEYYDCRYISACEAAWRLYKFPIHYQYPPVQRLSFHLPDEQPIVFEDDEVVKDVLSKPSVNNSQFLQWVEINKTNTLAQTLTYVEFPKYFFWNKKTLEWTRRKKGSAVGRINYVPQSIGEAFFLRILLNKKRDLGDKKT
ncbi:ATP-dependent DNA helicase RRM3-like protein [Tanacetum coccineum]